MDPKLLELLERLTMALEGIDVSLEHIGAQLTIEAKALELLATDPVYIPTGAQIMDRKSAAATRVRMIAAMQGSFPRSPDLEEPTDLDHGERRPQ